MALSELNRRRLRNFRRNKRAFWSLVIFSLLFVASLFAELIANDRPIVVNYKGVANLGVRPMFGENVPNFETHIFDFKGDLYGQHVSVALVEYLRPELKFASLQDLIDQMDDDSAKAREILAAR